MSAGAGRARRRGRRIARLSAAFLIAGGAAALLASLSTDRRPAPHAAAGPSPRPAASVVATAAADRRAAELSPERAERNGGRVRTEALAPREASVSVRVVGADDEPLGARVTLRRGRLEWAPRAVPGGRARFGGLAPGRYSVGVEASDLEPRVPPVVRVEPAELPFDLEPGEHHRLTFRVLRAARVSGRLRSAGAPVAGARLTLGSPSARVPRRAVTAGDGLFAFEGLAPGDYELGPARGSTRGGGWTPVELRLAAGEEAWLELVDDREPAVVTGRVVDPRGAPFDDLPVVCVAGALALGTARTDARGVFRLTTPAAARAEVRLHPRARWRPARGPAPAVERGFDPVPVDLCAGRELELGDLFAERAPSDRTTEGSPGPTGPVSSP